MNNAQVKPDKKIPWTWLRSRLFPRGGALMFWATYIITLAVLIQFVLDPGSGHGPGFYTAIVLLTLLLILNILWEDIERYFIAHFGSEVAGTWSILIASLGLIYTAAWSGQVVNTIYLIFMTVAEANSMLAFLPAILYSLSATAGWLGVMALMGLNQAELGSLAIAILVGLSFTVTLGQVVNRLMTQNQRARQLLEQLQAANRELVAARQKETELAIAEERVRVARDLHDGLGHHLTALSIQLQVVEKLVGTNPDQAALAAHNARSEVQAALKEVRQSVAVLREAPVDLSRLPEAIARLVEETGMRAGLETSFQQIGDTPLLSAEVAMTLYRTVQEGLTNIQKHAVNVSQIQVALHYHADHVSLVLQDNGEGAHPNSSAGGFGLPGMRERAALLGGSLVCGPGSQGGFCLELTIPLGAIQARVDPQQSLPDNGLAIGGCSQEGGER
jgi:signal transduction histidine kinase